MQAKSPTRSMCDVMGLGNAYQVTDVGKGVCNKFPRTSARLNAWRWLNGSRFDARPDARYDAGCLRRGRVLTRGLGPSARQSLRHLTSK